MIMILQTIILIRRQLRELILKWQIFLLGQRTLQIWIDGGELNVGATTKDVVNITKARDEINKKFLISAINWQIEGVALDNLNRVKSTKDFIGFERQKRSTKMR